MRRLIVMAVASGLLFGCATSPSPEASKIAFSNEKGVENCAYLGPVDGSSGVGGMMSSVGVNNARNDALEVAASLGATHLVNKSASGGWGSTFLADAYRCE
ncbi:DUF4156 domain-containing protein [Vibrio owensii]|uniref:DUF4156 domain-containing protein n=1 Tax=Vibrio owensii TaxID=696485 RepID=A0AAP9GFF8_9VIBR|nr:DUF4156 domain-containing protein [Vibrio owensii]AYO17042.1 DUF4156 domain-containing protein [Vibrio owensii]QGH49191.1 DUF4156 domain-containing protein [Vibrio owensii]